MNTWTVLKSFLKVDYLTSGTFQLKDKCNKKTNVT